MEVKHVCLSANYCQHVEKQNVRPHQKGTQILAPMRFSNEAIVRQPFATFLQSDRQELVIFHCLVWTYRLF